jgi:uncharacterized membrane protein YhiD involved in acid resistance
MMVTAPNNELLIGLAVALGTGLLIGIEREQRKGEGPAHIVAGVRTFALISLTGAVCTMLGTALIAVGAAFVGFAALLSYRSSRDADPGLTTEVAMFVAFLLGVLAMTQRGRHRRCRGPDPRTEVAPACIHTTGADTAGIA